MPPRPTHLQKLARRMFAATLLLGFAAASPGLADELPEVGSRPPWDLLGRNDDAQTGYVLHRRENPGSDIATYRLEAIVDSPPELVAIAATKYMADPENRPPNTDKEVLRADEDSFVVYSYIHIDAPFVSDRDVISLIERSYDAESDTHRIVWRAIDEGRPRKEGVVRLELSEGSWTFTPVAPGATRAVYTSRADSAGYLPAWLVRSQMSRTMVEGINGLREAVARERRAD